MPGSRAAGRAIHVAEGYKRCALTGPWMLTIATAPLPVAAELHPITPHI